ncbi:Kinase superfamily protein isoform 3 [Hibiscus syriacus]|uniref:Kinase superfamily protein isoform 3 n=1 Tax=Hibiscus syriacus TaxID=106335 RepID=A0A6A2Y9V9_HIBSY|nr:Kinase superfamily protein isoform 3 [Hibiscus syriacus]
MVSPKNGYVRAFGPVYKAQVSTGETVAVKVLASDSKQGEKEIQTEVMQMSDMIKTSEKHEPLSWNLRVYIALDVARGLEYLHEGVVPPVIHWDIKSSNILLDHSMRARVADFGLSREEMDEKFDVHELNEVATLAYKCVNRVPKKRHSMRDIVQVLIRILKTRHIKKHQKSLSGAVTNEVSVDLEQGETKILITVHRRDESMDSAADSIC